MEIIDPRARARLAALERKVYRIRLPDMEARATTLEQSLWQAWTGDGTDEPTTTVPSGLAAVQFVASQEGGALAGCPVALYSSVGILADSGTTDASGIWQSRGVISGSYTVQTTAAGRVAFSLPGIPLTEGTSGLLYYTSVYGAIYLTTTTLTAFDDQLGSTTLNQWDPAWNGWYGERTIAGHLIRYTEGNGWYSTPTQAYTSSGRFKVTKGGVLVNGTWQGNVSRLSPHLSESWTDPTTTDPMWTDGPPLVTITQP